MAERHRPVTVVDGDKVPLNEGLLMWQPVSGPPTGPAVPQSAVLDVLSGDYRPLVSRTSSANSPYHSARRPTALFFWSQRSVSSRKYLDWFVDFARHHSLMVCGPSTFFSMYHVHPHDFVVPAWCQLSFLDTLIVRFTYTCTLTCTTTVDILAYCGLFPAV